MTVMGHAMNPPPESAGSFVHVTVSDEGAGLASGLSKNGNTRPRIDIDISEYEIRAGRLVFEIANDSHFSIHEILLFPLPCAGGSVSDAAIRSAHDGANPEFLGETPLEPGRSLSVRVHLQPGEYALFVNSLGFRADMIWTSLTVAP
jgi:hypothetical protein